MKKVLVTGGNGFVGSAVINALVKVADVTVVDIKAPTHKIACKQIQQDYAEFFIANTEQYDLVVHLAASHLVEPSMTEPAGYYDNNVTKMKVMLDSMVRTGIKNIAFSSSGNVYGRQGKYGLLFEDLYLDPENPYASTKVAGELLIKDYANAYNLNYVNFRYFNAVGASPTLEYGYVQDPYTHVIPILCRSLLKGEQFVINGNDYPTPDKTCIRDYVHIEDIANAHISVLQLTDSPKFGHTINLGGGSGGVSVIDLTKKIVNITGMVPNVAFTARRKGDPYMLVADTTVAKEVLNWQPKYTIEDSLMHSFQWEQKLGK